MSFYLQLVRQESLTSVYHQLSISSGYLQSSQSHRPTLTQVLVCLFENVIWTYRITILAFSFILFSCLFFSPSLSFYFSLFLDWLFFLYLFFCVGHILTKKKLIHELNRFCFSIFPPCFYLSFFVCLFFVLLHVCFLFCFVL